MAKLAKLYLHSFRQSDRVVVISHGITQDYADMRPFAGLLTANLPDHDVYLFDYDWKAPILANGRALARELGSLRHSEITLVGYSMGGLVSRIAAAATPNQALTTVIGLATPNAGSISTADLKPMAQILGGVTRKISALTPCSGLTDLTKVVTLMQEVRNGPTAAASVPGKRYASVPALYHHEHRLAAQIGWGIMAVPAFGMLLANHYGSGKFRRPHDGIVSETSNNIAHDDFPFSEMDLATGALGAPPRLHARSFAAEGLDHVTVLGSVEIAELVAELTQVSDWSTLPQAADRKIFFSRA